MRRFAAFLPGAHVVVPGCGDGRDSRFPASLALQVTSFDLSEAMLRIAREQDPSGRISSSISAIWRTFADRSTAFGPVAACTISPKQSSCSA